MRLDNGATNAISPLMVAELSTAVAEIGRESSPAQELLKEASRKF